MKFLLLIVITMMMVNLSIAQNRKITGRVVDAVTQKPLKGANVVVRGTTRGTVVNHLGFFELAIDDAIDKQIVVSYVGYQTLPIDLTTGTGFKIPLEKEYLNLDPMYMENYPDKSPIIPQATKNSSSVYHVVESNAAYGDGMPNFYTDLGNAIHYRLPALKNPNTLVRFTIDRNGKATDIVFRDSTNSANPTIEKILKSMSAWTPATQNGDTVSQSFSLRIISMEALRSANQPILKFILNNTRYSKDFAGSSVTEFIVEHDTVSLVFTGDNTTSASEISRVLKLIPSQMLSDLTHAVATNHFMIALTFGENKQGVPIFPTFSGTNTFVLGEIFVTKSRKK